MSDMDGTVQRALVARIVADTGLDEHHAAAMVADVRSRGAASPHAQVVSDAAQKIVAPVIESFTRFIAAAAVSLQQMSDAIAPLAKAWTRSTPVL